MKCEIIKDLLPAYCDCVCSAETAAEIEQHTANCADCKKLLENYRSEVEPINKVEPEKPFRKIKRGIFRNKLAIAVLIILLAEILFVVGYLTYGQVVRSPYHPSFETIISSQKAKKLAKKFCEGDVDYVMENIATYEISPALYSTMDDVNEHCRNALADFYEKYFKGKNLQMKFEDFFGGSYDEFQYENEVNPLTEIHIFDGSTPLLNMFLYERSGGKLVLDIVGCNVAVSETDIGTLNFALNPRAPSDWVETAILNNAKDLERFEFYTRDLTETPEEERALAENFSDLMEDMFCENVFYTYFRFDKENSRYLIDMGYIFREESSGKQAVYTRTVKATLKGIFYHFEVLPEFEPIIIDDGISTENRKKLENLFVY
ncbi:MAG: zf-HC2 domain-containing protein [Oscillospiraceae bacterium]|nr:zf-HC2 domain-containing protein [Oscillospiraceae bacterium]